LAQGSVPEPNNNSLVSEQRPEPTTSFDFTHDMKLIAENKKAVFNYEIVEQYTAGIKLEGREIKSLRSQKPSFAGSFVTINEENVFLHELNIPRYICDGTGDYAPKRKRLLLLKKTEIKALTDKMRGQGMTIVPLAILFDRQWVKVKIALVRGKKKHDKRRQIREREEKRKAQRAMKKM
jgi:SsrA-binding protein